jgi:hypothetical protein
MARARKPWLFHLSLAAPLCVVTALVLPSGCSGESGPRGGATGSAGTNAGGSGSTSGPGSTAGPGGTGGAASGSGGDGGAGGMGASSSVSSTSGVGGGFTACAVREDCPPDELCKTYECADVGVCVLTYGGFGKIVDVDPGDCKSSYCLEAGGVMTTDNYNEIPADDGNECTYGYCGAGGVVHDPEPDGEPCSQGICQAGQCVTLPCQSAADCPGAPLCQDVACSNQACQYTLQPADTPFLDSSPSDCQMTVCDGAGSLVFVADPDDIPDDGNECTNDMCSGMSPSAAPKPDGSACAGGKYCSGGICAQCTTDAHCPASPCTSGISCINGACIAGPPLADGTSCNGNKVCYNGVCSQCVADAQCPAVTCKTNPSCKLGVCAYQNVANGTSCGFLKTCQNGQCV